MITILLQIVNTIFDHGSIPDILKVGLLTSVFKNKGNIAEVINYRGIIIETIIKNRTSHEILAIQNPIQRDRPFNLQGGIWFSVSFRIFFSDNTS
jgi:hypothetical protein